MLIGANLEWPAITTLCPLGLQDGMSGPVDAALLSADEVAAQRVFEGDRMKIQTNLVMKKLPKDRYNAIAELPLVAII